MLWLFFVGVLAGALTGVPIGPVNVAVIDTAYRHNLRRALFVALGGAVADGMFAALGVMGVTKILQQHPMVPPSLKIASGIILLTYGILTIRTKPVAPAHTSAPRARTASEDSWSGFFHGFGLICLNPAALITWTLLLGTFVPAATSRQEGIAVALGVLLGSLIWFSFVAYLADHGKNLLGEKAAWIPRVVGALLVLYSVYLIGSGGWTLLS